MMKSFHTTKCKEYPHKKWVVGCKELMLARTEEMAVALGKLGVTTIKRITIRKVGEKMETKIYILTLSYSLIPREVKIGFCLLKVQKYIAILLKCQKYGHHREREVYRGRGTCSQFGEKDQDHTEKELWNEKQYPNSRQDHPAYSRSCIVFKKEKEISFVKNMENISFLKRSKKVALYWRRYLRHSCRMVGINQSRALIEKLIQLKPNNWPKLQD